MYVLGKNPPVLPTSGLCLSFIYPPSKKNKKNTKHLNLACIGLLGPILLRYLGAYPFYSKGRTLG